MKAIGLISGAVLVTVGIFAYLHLHWGPSRSAVEQSVKAKREGANGRMVQGTSESDLELTVSRLQAELRLKDWIIRDLSNRPSPPLPAEASGGPSVQAPTEPPDEMAMTRTVLDERMLSGPDVPERAARLRSAIEAVMDADTLGDAKVASLECGANICKMVLTAESKAAIVATASRVAERTPKTFASTAFYPIGQGERAVYFATGAEDLAVDLAKDAVDL